MIKRTRTKKKAPIQVGIPAMAVEHVARKRGLVPEDPNFFKVIRLLQGKHGKEDALRGNVWAYSAIAAVAKPISSVPFIFLEDNTATGIGEYDQPDVVEQFVKRAREVMNGRGQFDQAFVQHTAYQPRAFDRYRALRRAYPFLYPYELTRVVGTLKVAPESDWSRLFRTPNEHTTSRQLVEETITILRTHGRCFWIMVGKTGRLQPGEVPSEIWPRTPAGWKAQVEKGMKLTGWELSSMAGEGGSIEKLQYGAHEVCLMRYVSPDNPLGGLSPLDPVKEEMKLDYLAQQYNVKFFENGATIGGVLVYPEPLGEVQEEIKEEEFNAEKGGIENAHSTLVLGGGAKWYPNLMTQHDMEHKDTRVFARDAILAAQRTPRAVIGLAEDHNKANQEAALRAHWDSNLVPEMTAYEDSVNALIDRVRAASTEKQPAIYAVFDLSVVEAFRESLWRKLKTANLLLMAGYTANMVNERLGLGMPNVPWGDTWYRTSGTTPVNEREEAPPPPDPNADKPAPAPDSKEKAGNNDRKKKEKVVKEAYEAMLRDESRALFERISSVLNTKFRQQALTATGEGAKLRPVIDALREKLEEDMIRIARRALRSAQSILDRSDLLYDHIDIADVCRSLDFPDIICFSLAGSTDVIETIEDPEDRQRALRDILNRFTSRARLGVVCSEAIGQALQTYLVRVYGKQGIEYSFHFNQDCPLEAAGHGQSFCSCLPLPNSGD